MIRGVERRTLELHGDARGTLQELWRASLQPFDARQLIVSTSTPGALRGMHVHFRQSDLLHVVSGRVFMALLDLRSEAPAKEELWLGSAETLLIPPGVAHGYATPDAAIVLYLLDHESDGSDEHGFSWADPEAAINWPVGSPRVSERDRVAGSMRTAIALARSSVDAAARPGD
jgi:dTDP-4-dehydrorhamnose 3,5-epimerase